MVKQCFDLSVLYTHDLRRSYWNRGVCTRMRRQSSNLFECLSTGKERLARLSFNAAQRMGHLLQLISRGFSVVGMSGPLIGRLGQS